ncbi:MAG: glutathione S-transferase [Proteobacteria bacterium]|nr:glutathione S-transferase [Pseudomonadota bacterium]
MTLTVHHLNSSRSHRVLWLLEELGVPYQIERYQRDPKTWLAPPELRRVHPLGRSPVITDGEHTVAESGAITEYVIDTYGNGRLRPAAGTPARLKYTYWLHYAEGSAMPPLVLKFIFGRLGGPPVPALLRPLARAIGAGAQQSYIDPQLALHLKFWDDSLAQDPWFAGPEFSAADIQMSFPLEAAQARAGAPLGAHVLTYLERIRARPAYQRALACGGSLSLPS